MNDPGLLQVSRVMRAATRVALFVLVASIGGVTFAGQITLTNDQIPPNPGTLKRLKLSRANPPTTQVQQALGNSHPTAKLESLGQSAFAKQHGLQTAKNVQAAIENDNVVASIDPTTGHADVVPNLANLTPAAKQTDPRTVPPLPAQAAQAAQTAAAGLLRQGLFPSDSTHAELGKPQTLNRSQFTAGANGAPAAFNGNTSGPILTSFPVHRLVGNLPVYGQGSRGSIHVSTDGKIHGFSRHWKTATDNDTVTETRSGAQIADLIRQQLSGPAAKGDVVVQDVTLGYYDGDANYMQPVYQYHAKYTVAPPAGGATGQVDENYITGYVAFGTDKPPLETIPTVGAPAGNPPGVPQGAPTNLPLSEFMPVDPPSPAKMASMPPKAVAANDPTVGRYVVRNDYSGWVNSANGFWNGLNDSGYGGYFSNSQYFWAYPFEYQGSKNSYINSVNVAESEVHGNWWYWTTYQNWGDGVSVDSIPYPGLGPNAGGVNAYFILHSCETTPSAADTGAWPDHWWHVFQGMHSVLGYRTIMMIDDGIMYPFGVHMGWGYGLMNAWLNDVISSSSYYCWFGNCPGEVMHGTWKPYGRPSVVVVCGHENDSVYYTAGVGPAGCLNNYWYY